MTVTAPEGSILNPRYPAAVAARHIVGHFLPHAVFGALAEVIPDRVMAEGAGNVWLSTLRGTGKNRFVTVFFASGGTGARPAQDGLSTTSFPSGIATSPIEIIESTSPLVFRRKEFIPDSGGAGKYRGGLGQRIEVEVRTGEPFVISCLADRLRFPAEGYDGGLPGSLAGFSISGEGAVKTPKLSRRVAAGATITLELPGGGGYHDPADRDPEAILSDLAEGVVTPDGARRDYGFDPDQFRPAGENA